MTKVSGRSQRKEILQKLMRKDGSLVMPYFVVEGKRRKNPVASMPGVFQLSVDILVKEVARARGLGIPAVILFGIPARKDLLGSGAYDNDGIVQKAVRELKKKVKGILVITDVCLCEYTSHGHCGIVKKFPEASQSKHAFTDFIDLKPTLDLLTRTALSHTEAGADMVAPSAMMHGQVKAIRSILDRNGFKHIPIMGYSAKFASVFYGPFRDAAESAPRFGDRSSYQLNPSGVDRALAEVASDIKEGADIVMVKPALAYLDVIRAVKAKFRVPLAAYNVSGEYAMVKAASRAGWVDEKKIVSEILTGIKRAGADIVITYHARDVARWKKKGG